MMELVKNKFMISFIIFFLAIVFIDGYNIVSMEDNKNDVDKNLLVINE